MCVTKIYWLTLSFDTIPWRIAATRGWSKLLRVKLNFFNFGLAVIPSARLKQSSRENLYERWMFYQSFNAVILFVFLWISDSLEVSPFEIVIHVDHTKVEINLGEMRELREYNCHGNVMHDVFLWSWLIVLCVSSLCLLSRSSNLMYEKRNFVDN